MTTCGFIYGPNELAIEQVSSGGTVSYLHHDQQGSTRLITSSSGEVVGKCSLGAYGSPDCEGSATTPLGYDGQYTNSDTGLIYLRAREYDPATGQLMSVDPLKAITGTPYSYAGDNPLNDGDPTGLLFGIELPSLQEAGTRLVGFFDGFTRPVFGGTAALRSDLGLSGGLDTCSVEYQVASNVGNLDASLEAGAAAGGLVEGGVDALGGLPVGVVNPDHAVRTAPVGAVLSV